MALISFILVLPLKVRTPHFSKASLQNLIPQRSVVDSMDSLVKGLVYEGLLVIALH